MTIFLLILFVMICLLSVAPQLRSMVDAGTERFAVDAIRWNEAKEWIFDIDLDDADEAAELLGLERK